MLIKLMHLDFFSHRINPPTVRRLKSVSFIKNGWTFRFSVEIRLSVHIPSSFHSKTSRPSSDILSSQDLGGIYWHLCKGSIKMGVFNLSKFAV